MMWTDIGVQPGDGEQPDTEVSPGNGVQPDTEVRPGDGVRPDTEVSPGDGEQPDTEVQPDSSGARIVITGATGFIGSNLARYFLERGAIVYALVRPGSKNRVTMERSFLVVRSFMIGG